MEIDTKPSVRLTRFSDRWDYIDRLFKELDSEKWRSLPRTNFELRFKRSMAEKNMVL